MNELLVELALEGWPMTDAERWERLQEALRVGERAKALQSVLAHYSGLVIEAGEPIPCPDCLGSFYPTVLPDRDGVTLVCLQCGSAFREVAA